VPQDCSPRADPPNEYGSIELSAENIGLLDGDLLFLEVREGSTRHTDSPPWAPRTFSRGDSNLLNWLWAESSSTVSIVDWEFAGYSDTAYDAAELVEHLSAHAIDDEVWMSLLPKLGIQDDTTRRRFPAAQRTVALRWLSVLRRRRHQRTDEFEYQTQRVHKLLNDNFLSSDPRSAVAP